MITRYGYKSWSGLSDNRRWHIYVVTLADKKVRRLTTGTYQDHSISWSPKGDEIAYISNGRMYPLIVAIHGGPHGQQGPGFVHQSQVYAGAGYSVVMVNYRGTSGYGQAFSDGTVNDQNGSEFKDVIAGLDYIVSNTPWLDPGRVGIEGGSYGGQLTNWAITQTTRFKSEIPSRSISNLLSHSFLIWAQDYPEVEWGGRHAWNDDVAVQMWKRSALAYVARAKTPTMFIHGELDQDVPIQEAEQMYIPLKQVGVETVLVRSTGRPRP